ncbi:glycerol-3-phosphate 1-O-acyltransferase PlsY [Amphritea pacifica]|uniref:Glycerol-3-phosphate acyltransferase n=1 Tax=Amphritea pacifica TaxID=2811233 RepID=A0ABS2W5L3_9GAMM|nr:glycerol-3-phosphate 1-O-acyltransferase PlsY [Amphritea pacifica]MBN0986880.1 glycerol-3-phosphate 1-O-acyltransferase PlsY [Amphritea pacifica]MBN1005333.1 glycerol-3-phosphate 1-O-acyltransferase PlsY [Amphritea pacifica]
MIEADAVTTLTIMLVGYLLGSIPFAVLICHFMGIGDPRQLGSGNPGATNVLRTGNRPAALLTLTGDLSKGMLAVSIALWAGLSQFDQALVGISALIGHVWSVFLRFRGGKGVATMIGSCLFLDYRLALAQCTVWLTVIAIRRISSLAAVSMSLLSPLFSWFLAPQLLLPIIIMSSLILATHHQNIRNLLNRRESRL